MITDATPDATVSRRRFLQLGAAAATLGACASSGVRRSGAAPTTLTTARPPSTTTLTTGPPTASDWAAFGAQLEGTLVLPADPAYGATSAGYNPRFDSIHPAGVVLVASATDVQRCIAFARDHGVQTTARSGGHSYAGYSTCPGLVIDLRRLNTITVDPVTQRATIGGGCRMVDVYSALDQQGRLIPAGSCPTVGMGGLALGGGLGVVGRKYGITSDSIRAVDMVTADGALHHCDLSTDSELLWGSQGGGGGNFGVVTSFILDTYATGATVTWVADWPWSAAADLVPAWLAWVGGQPDELWSTCLLEATGNPAGAPTLRTAGVWLGDVATMRQLLAQLARATGASPTSQSANAVTWMNAVMVEGGCYGDTVTQCHLPPEGILGRETYSAKSDFFTSTPTDAAVATLTAAIEGHQRNGALQGGAAQIDSCGGAIATPAPGATAWVHRDAVASIQYTSSWSSPAQETANIDWLRQTWSAMRPHVSGQAYQNYIDPDLPDWQTAYYGSNLARLQRLKQTVDPDDFWHFAQSIPLPGA